MECTSIKVSYYVCFQVSLTVLDTLHEREMDLTTSLFISMHQIKVTKKKKDFPPGLKKKFQGLDALFNRNDVKCKVFNFFVCVIDESRVIASCLPWPVFIGSILISHCGEVVVLDLWNVLG